VAVVGCVAVVVCDFTCAGAVVVRRVATRRWERRLRALIERCRGALRSRCATGVIAATPGRRVVVTLTLFGIAPSAAPARGAASAAILRSPDA
jgi:hypothetical protein